MKKVVTWIKVAVTVSLLGWLFLRLDLAESLNLLPSVGLDTVSLAFVLSLLMTASLAFRWQLLLRMIQIPITFREICSIIFISSFLGNMLPGNIGGEVVKIYYARRLAKHPSGLIFSILIDRYIGLLVTVSLPLAVMFIRTPDSLLEKTVGLLYAGVSALLLFAFVASLTLSKRLPPSLPEEPQGRFRRLFDSLKSSLDIYARQKATFLQVFGVAVLSQLLNIAVYCTLGFGFGEINHLLDFFYLVPAVELVAILPVSLGGMGVRELTFVSMFAQIGMPLQTAISISVLNLLVKIWPNLIGATLYLTGGRSRNP